MSNNNSKTNRNARRRLVLQRLEEYIKTGVYSNSSPYGNRTVIQESAMERIKIERNILAKKLNY